MGETKTLRRFTSEGLRQFEISYSRLHAGYSENIAALLDNDDLTEKISGYEIGQIQPFKDRMAAARQMDKIVSALNMAHFNKKRCWALDVVDGMLVEHLVEEGQKCMLQA